MFLFYLKHQFFNRVLERQVKSQIWGRLQKHFCITENSQEISAERPKLSNWGKRALVCMATWTDGHWTLCGDGTSPTGTITAALHQSELHAWLYVMKTEQHFQTLRNILWSDEINDGSTGFKWKYLEERDTAHDFLHPISLVGSQTGFDNFNTGIVKGQL